MPDDKQEKDNQKRCNAIKGAMAQLADTDMFDSVQILATFLEEGKEFPRFYQEGNGNILLRRESAILFADLCLVEDDDIEIELELDEEE